MCADEKVKYTGSGDVTQVPTSVATCVSYRAGNAYSGDVKQVLLIVVGSHDCVCAMIAS